MKKLFNINISIRLAAAIMGTLQRACNYNDLDLLAS